MSSEEHKTLLVVDARELRRASLIALLDDYAAKRSLILRGGDRLDAELLGVFGEVALCIVSTEAPMSEARVREPFVLVKSMRLGVPLVVVSDIEAAEEVLVAFSCGASAYVETTIKREAFFATLDFVLAGGTYFPPSVLRLIGGGPFPGDKIRRLPERRGGTLPSDRSGCRGAGGGSGDGGRGVDGLHLTGRQMEVLRGLRIGRSNKQIARDLDMAEATVKVHVRQILKKLGVANRTQAAMLASMEAAIAGEDAGALRACDDASPGAEAGPETGPAATQDAPPEPSVARPPLRFVSRTTEVRRSLFSVIKPS